MNEDDRLEHLETQLEIISELVTSNNEQHKEDKATPSTTTDQSNKALNDAEDNKSEQAASLTATALPESALPDVSQPVAKLEPAEILRALVSSASSKELNAANNPTVDDTSKPLLHIEPTLGSGSSIGGEQDAAAPPDIVAAFEPTSATTRTAISVQVADIFFESGRAAISARGQVRLMNATIELAHLMPRAVLVAGSTDRLGSQEANQELSERRADAVVAMLKELGVTAEIVRVAGGESVALNHNSDEVANPRGRRVRVVALDVPPKLNPAANAIEVDSTEVAQTGSVSARIKDAEVSTGTTPRNAVVQGTRWRTWSVNGI